MFSLINKTFIFSVFVLCSFTATTTWATELSSHQQDKAGQQIQQGPLILADMEKPPRKLSPKEAAGGALACMGQFQAYYERLRTNPTTPVPLAGSQQCHDCLARQADFSRPWSGASLTCRSQCCN